MMSEPLPLNDELLTHMEGLYLGDTNIMSQVMWLHSKLCQCHVLCQHDTELMHNPELILLHGVFNIVCQPFKLTADGMFSQKSSPGCWSGTSITEAMARSNAWAWLKQVKDDDLLGFEDFPQYLENIKAFESLALVGDNCYSLIKEGGVEGAQLKICHRMFEVGNLFISSFMSH